MKVHKPDQIPPQPVNAPLFTGGPVIAFGGRGAGATNEAAHLERISYTRLGDNVCVIGYPRFPAIT